MFICPALLGIWKLLLELENKSDYVDVVPGISVVDAREGASFTHPFDRFPVRSVSHH